MFLPAVSAPGQNRSADFEQARVALITPPRPAALLGSAAQLFVADHCQNCPQLLVASDRALIDLTNLVKGGVGEFDAVIADRKSAVRVVKDGYVFADRRLGRLARLDDEPLCRIAMSAPGRGGAAPSGQKRPPDRHRRPATAGFARSCRAARR